MNRTGFTPLLTRRSFVAAAGGFSLTGLMDWHAVGASQVAAPKLETQAVFAANSNGYASYRISGGIVTRRGTLLAYCEARRTGRGDWDAIDIVLKRSTDGGRTWAEQRKLAQIPGARRNPAAAREASVNQAREASVNQAREASVNQAREASVNQAREASVNQAREASVNQAREASVNQAREASVNQDRLTYNSPVAIADRNGAVHSLTPNAKEIQSDTVTRHFACLDNSV